MIFLYRFEVLEYDAALTTPAGSSNGNSLRRQVYTLTNYERPIFANTNGLQAPMLPDASAGVAVFSPIAIKHDGIRLDGEQNDGALKITLPATHPVAQLYLYDAPGAQVWVTLAAMEKAGDPPIAGFFGRLSTGDFAPDSQMLMCELIAQPLKAVLARPGLTRVHSRTCTHVLYDRKTCGIDRHFVEGGYWKYRDDATGASIDESGSLMLLPAAANRPNGWFSRGIVIIGGVYDQEQVWNRAYVAANVNPTMLREAKAPSAGIRRTVTIHDGNSLTLDVALPDHIRANLSSLPITVYAGCTKQPEMCRSSKFNNGNRLGAFEYIPLYNPFETDIRS